MYNERSLCLKYSSQGVQTSFYESTPPTRDPLGNKISSGAQRDSGHAGTNIPYASEERDNRGASEFPRILLVRIPGTKSSGGWHPIIDLKSLNAHIWAPHFRMYTTSSVLSTVRKVDYALQDRPAGYVLSCTNSSKQQEVPQICLQKQGLPVSGTSLPSEHSPSGFQGAGIADRNHTIVLGRLNKYMTDQHPAKPWGPREFFTGSCYYTHNTEGYVPWPESLVIPSRPPPAERSAEDQPFLSRTQEP